MWLHSMSIRKHTILIVSVSLAGFLAGGLFLVQHLLARDGRRMDETRLAECASRASLLLSERQRHLATTLRDYASWDLAYEALVAGDTAAVREECSLRELRDTGVDLVLLRDARGQIVNAEADPRLVADPRPLFAAVASIAAAAAGAADRPDWARTGYLEISDRLLLVSIMPILKSDSSGEAQGVMAIGRVLEETFWRELSRIAGARLAAAGELADEAPREALTARLRLPGLGVGRPPAVDVTVPMAFGAGARAELRFVMAAAAAAGSLIIALVLLLLERRLLARLAALRTRMQDISNSGDLTLRVDAARRDEIGELAEAINLTLESLAVYERSLTESRRSMATLLSNLPGMAYRATVIGGERYLQFASDGCAALLGRDAADLLGGELLALADLVHEDDRGRVEEQRRQSLARGEPYCLDYRLARGGGEIWVMDQGRGVCDDRGELAGVEGILIDITARVKAEEALLAAREQLEMRVAERTAALAESLESLRASEDELRAVIGASQDAMIAVDSESNIRLFNAAAARLFDVPAAEAVGGPLARLLPADQLVAHADRVRRLFAGEYPPEALSRPREVVLARPDGRRLTLEVSLSVVPRGPESLALAVLRDVTEKRRLEIQVAHGQKLESIGRLAAGIAHEINTPTQYVTDNTRFLQDAFGELREVLAAYAELAASCRAAAEVSPALEKARAAAEAADLAYLLEEIPQAAQQSLEGLARIAKIVGAMKEFSHPGSETPTPSDLNRAIESTATVSRNEWKYVAELSLDLDPELPLVPCLLGEFNQAMLNLITNAAHAIGGQRRDAGEDGAKGMITIRTRREGDLAVVSVSDTGHGVPEAIRDRIFDPFFTTKEVGRGTGQGLAIVRSVIVDKLGGSVDFASEVGRGTTFFLRLPLAAAAEAGPDRQAGSSPADSAPRPEAPAPAAADSPAALPAPA